MVAENFRRTHSPSRLASSECWRSVYIHQMNRVNSRIDFGHGDFGHHDSTINIVVNIVVIISIVVVVIIFYPR